jgi:hypothetical protein
VVGGGSAGGGVKSGVSVDGGGTSIVIDIGRECHAIDHGGSGGGGGDGWDDGGGVIVINDGRRSHASECGGSGGHVVMMMERCEEGCECVVGDFIIVIVVGGGRGDCACEAYFVNFWRGRKV